LADLTAELTTMLGSADDAAREEVAVATLTTWLRRGVYDDLLPGLGDGMASGLWAQAPVRRGASATVLGGCISRDRDERRVPDEKVLEWGDRLASWLLAERDRAAIGLGASALGALARHPACGAAELAVLLDVIAERAHGVTDHSVADRLAVATLQVFRRDLVPVDVVEAWLEHLDTEVDSYLRSTYLHLSLAPKPPKDRADLLLLVVDRLRDLHRSLRTTE
jgi:hypothetical protein